LTPNVAVYSIKDLENLSGIKAHTLRIWEQRYNLIQPSRTKTNIRYYEDHQLRLILNIALLNRNGFKISKIASMSPDEIADKVTAIAEINFSHDTQVDALSLAMMDLDEMQFDKLLSTHTKQHGFEQTMLNLVFPFLDRLNLLWLTGSVNPVHEHFITNLIRQKIIAAIDSEPLVQGRDTRKFLLYLPEDEKQELILLFMHYLLKTKRHRVIYLGTNISLPDLNTACVACKPDYIFTIINEMLPKHSVKQYIEILKQNHLHTKILLTGYQVVAQDIQSCPQMQVLHSLPETIDYLQSLRSATHTLSTPQ
jgi:DNA-binding transcriptional MerR regulator